MQTIRKVTDLVNWSNSRSIEVAASIEAGNAWAPEALYDETTGEYLLYWSSKVKSDNFARNYSFVVKTRDFYSFTEPELFNDLSISNIDTSCYKEGDKYYKLVKLEAGGDTRVILQSKGEHPLAYGEAVNTVTIGNRTYKNLGAGYSTIDNTKEGALEGFRGDYEGATMFKFIDQNKWCVMVDEYGGKTRGYIPFVTDNLDKPNSVRALEDGQYEMSVGAKHGVIIPITEAEYQALEAKWGPDANDSAYIDIEAESAKVNAPARRVMRGDASGGVKVGYVDNENATVTFTLDAPKAGLYTVELFSDSGADQRNSSHKVYVNGDVDNAKIVRYESAGWDNWKQYPIEVSLKEGKNTFTVTHSGLEASYSEIDKIRFYRNASAPWIDGILVGGKAIDGFDSHKFDYEIKVDSLNDLPNVSAVLPAGYEDYYTVKYVQGDDNTPEARINITAKDGTKLTYRVRFLGDRIMSTSIVNFGADPFVTYKDGFYYYIRVHQDRKIYITKSAYLDRIDETQPYMVYEPKNGEPDRELWAPEMHYLNGCWYIYYTAGAGANHRLYVLKAKEADNPIGQYDFAGELEQIGSSHWGIDMTVLEKNNQLYAIWSGWEGYADGRQDIYIAKMSDPETISSERVMLSKPEYAWETNEFPHVEEGPQIITSPNGVTSIMFSASGSWSDNYCLATLTLKENADPMNADSWIKSTEPVFKKNGQSTFSTGHACVVPSPDKTEDYLVYHATKGSGQGWAGRGPRVQRLFWNEDGTPYFGEALSYDDHVNVPSGTPELNVVRFEVEDAKYTGGLHTENTYKADEEVKEPTPEEPKDPVVNPEPEDSKNPVVEPQPEDGDKDKDKPARILISPVSEEEENAVAEASPVAQAPIITMTNSRRSNTQRTEAEAEAEDAAFDNDEEVTIEVNTDENIESVEETSEMLEDDDVPLAVENEKSSSIGKKVATTGIVVIILALIAAAFAYAYSRKRNN